MKKTPEEYQEYRREVVRASQRKRRMIAKERGLCSICCRNVPETGLKTCKECRIKISMMNSRRAKG